MNARAAMKGFTFLEVLASIVLLAATATAVVPWLQASRRGDDGFKQLGAIDALSRDVDRIVGSKLKSSILVLETGETRSLAPPPLKSSAKDDKATRPFFEDVGAAGVFGAADLNTNLVRVSRVAHPPGSTRLRGSFFEFSRGDLVVLRWLVPDAAKDESTKDGQGPP